MLTKNEEEKEKGSNNLPGTSAANTRNPSLYSMHPTRGCKVVKGYGAIIGFAMDMAAKSEDLPFNKKWRPRVQ